MKKEKTEKEILLEINEVLKKILAVNAIQGKNDEMKIRILIGLGYNSFEMSELTGIPAATIRGKRNKK